MAANLDIFSLIKKNYPGFNAILRLKVGKNMIRKLGKITLLWLVFTSVLLLMVTVLLSAKPVEAG